MDHNQFLRFGEKVMKTEKSEIMEFSIPKLCYTR
jgi:hypothetical protein